MRPIAATTSTIRTHRPQRRLNWVSKTDVVRYLRCPYAFWQIDSGALAPEAAIDALGERLIEDGVAFEGTVTAEARPLPPGVDLADAFVTEARVYGLPRLENHQLELHGIPDAVTPPAGGSCPSRSSPTGRCGAPTSWSLRSTGGCWSPTAPSTPASHTGG